MVPMWIVFSMIVTPSLAYMAEVASAAGFESYGVVYGVYNMAWAVGLMVCASAGRIPARAGRLSRDSRLAGRRFC